MIRLENTSVDTMESSGGERFAFYISSPERLWRIAAPSLLEMQEWITALRDEKRRYLVPNGPARAVDRPG